MWSQCSKWKLGLPGIIELACIKTHNLANMQEKWPQSCKILQESWPPTRFLARCVRSWPAWTTSFLQEPFVWVYYMYVLNCTQLRDNFHYGHSCLVSTNMWMVTYPTGGNPSVQCSLICLIKKVAKMSHGYSVGNTISTWHYHGFIWSQSPGESMTTTTLIKPCGFFLRLQSRPRYGVCTACRYVYQVR